MVGQNVIPPEGCREIDEFLGEPVPVNDDLAAVNQQELVGLAFNLYKEAAKFVGLAISVGGEAEDRPLPRNQAICAGLLMRIAKFQLVITQLTAESDRGEVVHILNRCIIESAVNLQFLIGRNEQHFYDQFVLHSLGPERELYDTIQRNIEARGGERLPIEDRMLASIYRMCRMSGTRIQDANARYGDWGGGLYERLRFLGIEELYLALQRLPSHAVHGSWVDLALQHLVEAGEGFRVDESWGRVDSRLLLPICIVMILPAVRAYLQQFLPDCPERDHIFNRIDDLLARMSRVEAASEAILGRND